MPGGPHAGNRNRPAYSGQQRFRFPKQIIQLFAPRKPVEFKPPPRKRRLRPMMGIAAFVSKFESADEQPDALEASNDKNVLSFETPAQRRRRVRDDKAERVSAIVREHRKSWDPFKNRNDIKKTADAFKTLFVANVPFETLEQRLHDEFETFGPVKSLIMPKDRECVPRGYAFVEFERERDLKVAYRDANGIRIDGRRILVDVERARTVKDWAPNRLDGPNNSCARRRRPENRDVRPPT